MWNWPWTVAETATAFGALLGTIGFIERRLEKWLARRSKRREERPDVEVRQAIDESGNREVKLIVRNRWRNTLLIEAVEIAVPKNVMLRTFKTSPQRRVSLGYDVPPQGTMGITNWSPFVKHAPPAVPKPVDWTSVYLSLEEAETNRPFLGAAELCLHLILKATQDRRETIRFKVPQLLADVAGATRQ
jgi:hypothetical protein